MNKYHIYVTGPDAIGMAWIQNIIQVANLGGVIKPGTLPSLRFPHSVSMVLEAETPPTPTACIRVFEHDTGVEIKAEPVVIEAAKFMLDEGGDSPDVMTREKLDAMTWDEVRNLAKDVGISGRDRDKVSKQYLEKVASLK